ncbi:MAG: Gfo/Idh/MocA family oxidoreductase, partial [Actinobacteria bacterium]|nr:Gfo/Idh/MocA family oxidoreductase [Actinomycetota bacterium]
MTSVLRVGIASWAHVHAPGLAAAIASLPEARLSGIHDEDPERGRPAAEARGVPWCADLEELLGRSDAVVVASTNARRRAYVEAAAKAGLHVLTEKPLAT